MYIKGICLAILLICINFLLHTNICQAVEQSQSENIKNPQLKVTEPSTLEEAIKISKRKNVLLLGKEAGPRTDTIVFISFDPETKKIDMISIPRDTYYYEKGYDNGDQRKINAKYGRSKEKGTMEAIGKILGGVPVHNYVTLNYESVELIVNALGGVEVDIPQQIENIPKGKQNLDGKNALVFLRYRKGYSDGDLGRIRAQQQFIKSAIQKLFSIEVLPTIKETLKNIQTDMTEQEVLSYAIQTLGIKTESISIRTLPGRGKYKEVGGRKWAYYFYDQEKSKEIMLEIYGVEKN
ncbi:LCP family protein [Wukongibacter baidiensis]|uniref:LCP family protein n=1 Tax=Wukongibacter baidiensis TaxID=1723361 RepID=UPI003D7FC9BC